MATDLVTAEQRAAYERDGFFVVEGFADAATGRRMFERVVELVRCLARGEDIAPAFVLPEQQADFRTGTAAAPEAGASKVFRLARDPVFHEFATRADVVAIVSSILPTDAPANFLSQFIFKNPGAWGQP